MPITLGELVHALPMGGRIYGDPDVLITAPITEDSRDAQVGGLFVARRGLANDGHEYLAAAVARGVAALVTERELPDANTPYLRVDDAAQALGFLAAAYYGYPSRALTVIGVTGTDGKTTTSTLIHAILKASPNVKAGLISTIAADFGDGETADTGLHVTSPGAPQLQAILAQMRDRGLTHVVLEATSHGLAQGRLNGVDLDIAVMTNVTHEHLDYHGTWEAYRDAKARLFRMLMASERTHGQSKVAVINHDDPSADYFYAIPAEEKIRYGLTAGADARAEQIVYLPNETRFTVSRQPIRLQLPGAFNVQNALAAIAATRAGLRMGFDSIQAGIASVESVSGRMQPIDEGQAFIALVDFAHTPNALQRALEAARTMVAEGGRLICVFGCAGLRDREKRRMMPQTAVQLADLSIFTAEDRRTESLEAILQTMSEAAVAVGGQEGQNFMRVADRGQALYVACQQAKAGDVVIACGKGHEQSMAFGTVEYAWDDREALRAALQGMPLTTLPTAQRWQS
jgi:UDP-N-acetylmuramoyl-L-alanyl-D-glutamate--2,6-diaminopimelate ligase